jgi:photosystem II stability/assembly factor-like uncharacterized protein
MAVCVVAGATAPQRGVLFAQATSTTLPQSLEIGRGAVAPLPRPAAPANWGPAPDQQGLVFTSGGTGFLAAGPGAYGSAIAAPAEVQRTTDQGKAWGTVWHRSGYRITWVGLAGDSVVAAGLSDNGQRPLMLFAGKSGAPWHLVGVSVSRSAVPADIARGQVASAIASLWGSYQFHFLSASIGFAAPDPMVGQGTFLPGVLLRTSDGGRTWAPAKFAGGTPTGGLAFIDAKRGFATGAVDDSLRSRPCPLDQLWATSDGGSSWQAVLGTCTDYQLTSLDFLDARTGFAGGGQYLKYSGYGQELALLGTTDGGRHWSWLYRASVPGAKALDVNPFGELAFFNAEDGLALDGGQTVGGNAPIGGHLWRTSDGGRHWQELSVTGLRLVLDGPSCAWLVGGRTGEGGDVLWRSLDRGRSWEPVGNPGYVKVSALSGYGPRLWLSTEAGDFLSYDGGAHWAVPPAGLQDVVASTWPSTQVELGADGTVLVGPGWAGDDTYWLSSDGGRSGKFRKLPALALVGIAALAFDNPAQGMAVGNGTCSQPARVLATRDAGASWQAEQPLEMTVSSLAVSRRLVVATGWGCNGNTVAISTDLGRSWAEEATGYLCEPASVYEGTVAMSCTRSMPGGQYLLFSRDGGRHWLPAGNNPPSAGYTPVSSVVLTGRSSLLVSGPPGSLLESSDAEAHWAVRRLLLPLVP